MFLLNEDIWAEKRRAQVPSKRMLRNVYEILAGNLNEINHMEDQTVSVENNTRSQKTWYTVVVNRHVWLIVRSSNGNLSNPLLQMRYVTLTSWVTSASLIRAHYISRGYYVTASVV
jgi:hypothetical protein